MVAYVYLSLCVFALADKVSDTLELVLLGRVLYLTPCAAGFTVVGLRRATRFYGYQWLWVFVAGLAATLPVLARFQASLAQRVELLAFGMVFLGYVVLGIATGGLLHELRCFLARSP